MQATISISMQNIKKFEMTAKMQKDNFFCKNQQKQFQNTQNNDSNIESLFLYSQQLQQKKELVIYCSIKQQKTQQHSLIQQILQYNQNRIYYLILAKMIPQSNQPLVQPEFGNVQMQQNNQNNFKQEDRTKYPQRQKHAINIQQLYNQFINSCKIINQNTLKKIQRMVQHQQQKNYLYYTNPQLYLSYMKTIAIDQIQEQNNQYLTPFLLSAIQKRQTKVFNQLQNNEIQIENILKKSLNNSESEKIVQDLTKNNEETNIDHKTIAKQYFNFLHKEKQQKEKIRLAKQKQIKVKEQKGKKIKQLQEERKIKNQEQRHKILSEQFRKNEQKRKREQQLRSYRDKEYHFILKGATSNMPLFEKMQTSFSQRYQRNASQEVNKLKEEKLRYFKRIDQMNLESHLKKYQAWKEEDQNKRLERLQQHQKMLQLYEQQLANKYKKNNQDEQEGDFTASKTSRYSIETKYINKKQEERKKALERRKKNIKYFQQIVKPNHKPVVDQNKRKELLNLIKDMQIKKLKKITNQNGEISYEQVKPSDPKIIGLQYLQKAKEIGLLMKGKKRKLSQTKIQTKTHKKKYFDYLQQVRNNPNSLRKSNRFSFLQKQDMTFEQKLSKVQLQTQKLQQSTQQSEIQLKFGKFKTSEEILQHKESIDLNHIQILKMKLKLVNQKN